MAKAWLFEGTQREGVFVISFEWRIGCNRAHHSDNSFFIGVCDVTETQDVFICQYGGTQFWSIFADGWKNWREKYRIMRTLFVV